MGSLSVTPADAVTTSRLKIEGSPTAVANFARMFHAPTAETQP
jgi:hypothetical protein